MTWLLEQKDKQIHVLREYSVENEDFRAYFFQKANLEMSEMLKEKTLEIK